MTLPNRQELVFCHFALKTTTIELCPHKHCLATQTYIKSNNIYIHKNLHHSLRMQHNHLAFTHFVCPISLMRWWWWTSTKNPLDVVVEQHMTAIIHTHTQSEAHTHTHRHTYFKQAVQEHRTVHGKTHTMCSTHVGRHKQYAKTVCCGSVQGGNGGGRMGDDAWRHLLHNWQ